MKLRHRIYIAGPITGGNRTANFAQSCSAMSRLLTAGYAPFCPHLTMLHPEAYTLPYEDWMEFDFSFLSTCVALLRLPGESPGADREMTFALDHNIDIFHREDLLLEFLKSLD